MDLILIATNFRIKSFSDIRCISYGFYNFPFSFSPSRVEYIISSMKYICVSATIIQHLGKGFNIVQDVLLLGPGGKCLQFSICSQNRHVSWQYCCRKICQNSNRNRHFIPHLARSRLCEILPNYILCDTETTARWTSYPKSVPMDGNVNSIC